MHDTTAWALFPLYSAGLVRLNRLLYSQLQLVVIPLDRKITPQKNCTLCTSSDTRKGLHVLCTVGVAPSFVCFCLNFLMSIVVFLLWGVGNLFMVT